VQEVKIWPFCIALWGSVNPLTLSHLSLAHRGPVDTRAGPWHGAAAGWWAVNQQGETTLPPITVSIFLAIAALFGVTNQILPSVTDVNVTPMPQYLDEELETSAISGLRAGSKRVDRPDYRRASRKLKQVP
jgi:hypothetical protein